MAQTTRVSGVATVIGSENGKQFVSYHGTKVVQWDSKEIVLNNNGWFTNTSKTRMNQASNQFDLGFCVTQKDFDWFVSFKGGVIPYENGMVLRR